MPEPVLVADGPALCRAGLVHRVLAPPGPGPHPTVVLVHGRGGDEDVMWIFARTLPSGTLVVAPRAPLVDSELGGFVWVPRTNDEWPTFARFAEVGNTLAHFLAALPELYSADPGRVSLMGFSQGAAMAFGLAFLQPRSVSAVASLVGFVPDGVEGGGKVLAGLPVFMLVGRRDTLVPPARARASAATLRTAGAELRYREYDVAHKVSAAGLADLTAWWTERRAADGPA